MLQTLAVQSPVRITDNGVRGTLYNGVADWLYEEVSVSITIFVIVSINVSFSISIVVSVIIIASVSLLVPQEILGQSQAIWVAPDGSRLAYAVFNDTRVQKVTQYMTLILTYIVTYFDLL